MKSSANSFHKSSMLEVMTRLCSLSPMDKLMRPHSVTMRLKVRRLIFMARLKSAARFES